MAQQRISVSPEVLIWARGRAGLPQLAAAKKLGVSDAVLGRREDGTLSPTIGQLRKAAHVCGWSLGVLLLPDPPTDFDPVRDFRGLRHEPMPASPEINRELRRAHEQREVMLEIAEVSPDSVPEPVAFPEIEPLPTDQAGLTLRAFFGFADPAEHRFSISGSRPSNLAGLASPSHAALLPRSACRF